MHKLILTFKLNYVLMQEEFVPLLDLVHVSLSQLKVVLQAMCRCKDWESLLTDITKLTNSKYWGIALAYFFYILQAVAKGGVEVDVIFEYVMQSVAES